MKKTEILWLNGYDMSESQIEALKQLYGDINITHYKDNISNINDVKKLIDNADIIAQNLPVNLQQQIMKMAGNKPVISAINEKRELELVEGQTEKQYKFVFKAWEQVDHINVKVEPVLPVSGYLIGAEWFSADQGEMSNTRHNPEYFCLSIEEASEKYLKKSEENRNWGFGYETAFFQKIYEDGHVGGLNYEDPLKQKNVLWFSRHDMSDEQISALKSAYGSNIKITQINQTVQNAYEIQDQLKNADIVCAVAPINIQQQMKEIIGRKPLLVAQMEKVGEKLQFKNWNEIANITVEKHALQSTVENKISSLRDQLSSEINKTIQQDISAQKKQPDEKNQSRKFSSPTL